MELLSKAELQELPPDLAQRITGLPAKRQTLLYVLADPENTGTPKKELAKLAKVRRTTLWRALQDREFSCVLEELRSQVLGLQRNELAFRIVKNAMMDPTPEMADFILQSQRMAAAFLDLQVDKPVQVESRGVQVVQHQGSMDLVHTLARDYPPDVVKEYAETGNWPERADPPPWQLPEGTS